MIRCWAEISLRKLQENLLTVRSQLGASTAIIAVVKANGYGHGCGPVARALFACGVRAFAVATLEEALDLRKELTDCEILVLAGCSEEDVPEFREFALTAALFERRKLPHDIRVAVKIDSGMGRLGLSPSQALGVLDDSSYRITSVFSHFAAAETDRKFTDSQLRRFLEVTRGCRLRRHICNSAAIRFPSAHLEAVRPGIALYGIASCPEGDSLQPVLTWKTRVLAVNEVPAGTPVGYGGSFVTARPSRIGVLGVGYADGYDRRFSNTGKVRVGQLLAPVVGQVNMDLISVDLTEVGDVRPGDVAVLLEALPESPISARSLAQELQTIPYEVLTRIGDRVHRTYVDAGFEPRL